MKAKDLFENNQEPPVWDSKPHGGRRRVKIKVKLTLDDDRKYVFARPLMGMSSVVLALNRPTSVTYFYHEQVGGCFIYNRDILAFLSDEGINSEDDI